MVERGHQTGVGFAGGKFPYLFKILFCRHLHVLFAAKGKDTTFHLGQIVGGVEFQECLEPRQLQLLTPYKERFLVQADGLQLAFAHAVADTLHHILQGGYHFALGPNGVSNEEKLPHAGETFFDKDVGNALHLEQKSVLLQKYLVAGKALTAQKGNERHFSALSSHYLGNKRPFAVSDDAYATTVDTLVLAQEIEGTAGVVGEIEGCGLGGIAGGTAHATVVVAEYGNASTGEIVGDDKERLVDENLLVSVLLPRAGDKHHGGELTAYFGQRQRTRKSDGAVGGSKGNLLLVKRIRLYGRLRTVGLERTIGGVEGDSFAGDELLERAVESIGTAVVNSCYFETYILVAENEGVARKTPRGGMDGGIALKHGVDYRHHAVAAALESEVQRQLHGHGKPVAAFEVTQIGGLSVGVGKQRSHKCQKCE